MAEDNIEVGESIEVTELIGDDIVVTSEDGSVVEEVIDLYDAEGNLVAEEDVVDVYDADGNLVAEAGEIIVEG